MLFGIITLMLVILKVTEAITIAWIWVFTPMIVGVLFDLTLTAAILKGAKQ